MSARRAMIDCIIVSALVFGGGCANLLQMPGENENTGGVGGTPTGAKAFFANLSGDQEVPPVDVAASGTAALTLNDDDTEVSLDISATGITGAVTGMHLHGGASGANGGIILDLTDTVVDSGDGNVGAFGSVPISADVVRALRDGLVYLNIHTENNVPGEIRGQFGPPS